jgi:DNA-directed RNA polymerase sigma subunit (sigma70/sigma32)
MVTHFGIYNRSMNYDTIDLASLDFVDEVRHRICMDELWNIILMRKLLTDRECQVLVLYYPLEWTTTEIAKLYGISCTRVGQIRNVAEYVLMHRISVHSINRCDYHSIKYAIKRMRNLLCLSRA